MLPSGKVLVAGGYSDGAVASVELYDTASDTWTVTNGTLTAARNGHTATLRTGEVLAAGGVNGSGHLASTELYDVGLDFSAPWQPQISSAAFNASGQLILSGSGFTGFNTGSASSGNTQDSASNVPVVQLRALENQQSTFLLPSSAANFSATTFTSAPGPLPVDGTYLVTVTVNGIPSPGRLLVVDNSPPRLMAVGIASGNANPAQARLGDTVTLSFTASEAIVTPTVTIAGRPATVSGSGTNWTASTTVQAGDAQGTVTFSIAFAYLAGNAGTAVSATTNASTVTIDTVAPTLLIGAPNVVQASTGPVSFAVTYGGASAVTLNSNVVTVNATGTAAAGTVTVTGNGSAWTVELSSLTGNGTLGISLPLGTARDAAGNLAAAAGPSATVQVKNPAVDDVAFTTARRAIVIDVLENDAPVAGGGAVTLALVTPPQHGTATVSAGKFRFVPEGPLPADGDRFTYRYDDGTGGVGTATVTVANLAAIAGSYDGLIADPTAAPGAEANQRAGHLRLQISKLGTLTGVLRFAGDRVRADVRVGFRGVGLNLLGATGGLERTLKRPPLPPLQLRLRYDVTARSIIGTAGSSDLAQKPFTSSFTLLPATDPGPRAGSYTLLIEPENTVDSPQGTGFGTLTLQRSGRVKAVGRLADGTVYGSVTGFHAGGSFPLYACIYLGGVNGRGSVRGTVSFPAVALPVGDASGVLDWFKPARKGDLHFASGLNLHRQALLGRYRVPAPQTRLLDFPAGRENGVVTFTRGGIAAGAPLTQTFTLGADSLTLIPTANRALRELTFEPKTGVFRGAFVHPITRRKPRSGARSFSPTRPAPATSSARCPTTRATCRSIAGSRASAEDGPRKGHPKNADTPP